ncbi:hypothetical protein HMF8227_02967 [Saliniradius amylolyticus]|uniref:Na(+)-translocating NADH-quinone reductase subunit B n=1 Tax=Saliniradius amylolyticus TaxID=2183582 RepID=A0A2S2E701_9ALTE|nr:DUF6482 family protein [Saliniradius amylolyticus]AWL13415.1 hypothetical protein HMF8227_02967 [Saliniradius amylolyticus]
MEIQYARLNKGKPLEQLYVRALEMGIYLVEVDQGQGLALLYNGDRPMRFHSLTLVKKAFVDFTVKQAKLCHESPYDEMIGNGPVSAESMELPLNMKLGAV